MVHIEIDSDIISVWQGTKVLGSFLNLLEAYLYASKTAKIPCIEIRRT